LCGFFDLYTDLCYYERRMTKKKQMIKKLLLDIEKARRDVREGKVYTLEQVEKILNLK